MAEKKSELKAPQVTTQSRRLIGIELEIDAGRACRHDITVPNGWIAKPDGSLLNGLEYNLHPPQPAVEALPSVELFSAALKTAKCHIAKSGGYHIHVQISDYEHRDCYLLAKLYQHFQKIIDQMVGPSRRSTESTAYNHAFNERLTLDSVVQMFSLASPARTREEAKRTRGRKVVNLAMARCSDRLDRTVEFRQGSSSKRVCNIWGWACLMVALTDASHAVPHLERYFRKKPTLRNFLSIIKVVEKRTGSTGIVDWVKWRIAYLNGTPSDTVKNRMMQFLLDRPRGIFSLARIMNTNLTAAKKVVQIELEKGGLVEVTPGKYRSAYARVAHIDLLHILSDWSSTEQAAANPASVQTVSAPVLPQPVSR